MLRRRIYKMCDWTKVLIYGTFDGFTFSTYETTRINVVLDGGEIVEVPEDFVVSADQMVNKHKIKLKDVIARIEKFDLATKAVWINEILYKLGSDYGLHKYYTGYKQGKFDGAMEREKVTVPQFVADWIEKADKKLSLRDLMSNSYISFEVNGWLGELDEDGAFKNQETFVRAVLDGYEVEKEKQYEVILCNGQSLKTVYRQGNDRLDFEKVYGDLERFTRKQLEDAGFGWMFYCPGIEVREVE